MVKWVNILKVRMVKSVNRGIFGYELVKIKSILIIITQIIPKYVIVIFNLLILLLYISSVWTHLTIIYPFDHFLPI